MNKIILSFFFIMAFGKIVVSQNKDPDHPKPIEWQTGLKAAMQKSKSENKHLLIYFTGSDWCGPCKMLYADFFESDEFKAIAEENLILYKADSPRNRDLLTAEQKRDNKRLKSKYQILSYPTIVVLNAKGKLQKKMKGYNLMRDTRFHFDFIRSVLE